MYKKPPKKQGIWQLIIYYRGWAAKLSQGPNEVLKTQSTQKKVPNPLLCRQLGAIHVILYKHRSTAGCLFNMFKDSWQKFLSSWLQSKKQSFFWWNATFKLQNFFCQNRLGKAKKASSITLRICKKAQFTHTKEKSLMWHLFLVLWVRWAGGDYG